MSNILCFGDSNTWGLNPVTGERFPSGIRWTSRLQEKLGLDFKVIEEGLCGRTTVYEDATRPGLRGIDSIKQILEGNKDIQYVVLMLGTNDCKTYNRSNPKSIASGINQCLDIILKYVKSQHVLLISPILLGEKVWETEYDPEFSRYSVQVSKGLKGEYQQIARARNVNFLAASDYVGPSIEDQEHLNVSGHQKLAEVIYHQMAW